MTGSCLIFINRFLIYMNDCGDETPDYDETLGCIFLTSKTVHYEAFKTIKTLYKPCSLLAIKILFYI